MNATYRISMGGLTALALIVLSAATSSAQLPPEPRNVRNFGGAIQIFPGQMGQQQSLPGQGGPLASLKTDPELEAILEKADRFGAEKQFGIASKLWQSVLERSGDALFTGDGEIYFSLSRQVEKIIASQSPDDGLATYRITADANAKEILAEAGDPYDERALQLVVRNYFLSNIGDDVAMKLSAIYMDQFDFVGAYRLLEKIVEFYPDPSVSISDVMMRMAICRAMMGEEASACELLASAREMDSRNDLLLKQVEDALPAMIGRRDSSRSKTGYVMAMGNRGREGVMPALPHGYFSKQLDAVWQYYFMTSAVRQSDMSRIKPITGENVAAKAAASVLSKERALINKWRKNKWRPTGNLLFDNDYVYFKTAIDLAVWNRKALDADVVWRPLWQNRYEVDQQTKYLMDIRRRGNRRLSATQPVQTEPTDGPEIQLFSDRIASQMSIQDGVIYSIEGPRTDMPVNAAGFGMSRFRYVARRSRVNHLTAYDAKSGLMLWTLPPIDDEDDVVEAAPEDPDQPEPVPMDMIDIDDGSEETEWMQVGGFMSAPILYDGLVIAPVNHGGSISVYALDPKQAGKTVWRSYLCDETETGANAFAPVNLTINGSDLFASCGLGVVFVLDPTTGLVRFAKRYQRGGELQFSSSRFARSLPKTKFEFWQSDTVVAHGRQMICFSSDAKFIESHDRNTGELIWRCPVDRLEAKVDYLLGVKDGMLYAGGQQTILVVDLNKEGLLVWGGEPLFGNKVSYGRGMLTTQAIYMPVEDQIVKFSLNNDQLGKPMRSKTASIELGTGAPVGNLFSDGKRIWVHGANRVYALGPASKKDTKKVGQP